MADEDFDEVGDIGKLCQKFVTSDFNQIPKPAVLPIVQTTTVIPPPTKVKARMRLGHLTIHGPFMHPERYHSRTHLSHPRKAC